MKKFMIIVMLLVMCGCEAYQQQQMAERQALIQRFQQAYPNTWQQELLKYDIEQERYEEEKADRIRQRSIEFRRLEMEQYDRMKGTIYQDGKPVRQ